VAEDQKTIRKGDDEQDETRNNNADTSNDDEDGARDEQGDQKDEKDDDTDDDKDETDEKPRSKLPLFIGIGVVILVIIAGVIYWIATSGQESTDDAYTDGRAVSMASNVSGYCTVLNVTDNSYVRKGALLAVVDPRPNEASLAQAQANLVLAQAQLASARTNLVEERVKAPASLSQAQGQLVQAQAQLFTQRLNFDREINVNQRATSANEVDQAHEQLKAAEAQVQEAQAQVATASLIPEQIATAQQQVDQRAAQVTQAQANLAAAQVELGYSYIRAPEDGWITERNIDPGNYVQAGQQIFYIVTPDQWVTANLKETQLSDVRIGDRVTMTVDAYPWLLLHGHVQSIQLGSGARFSQFPAENATGNYVKIVRRVPVKIVIDSGLTASMPALPIGISVEPTIYVP
jgi:membrane fusion protein (multidrug efflux system)